MIGTARSRRWPSFPLRHAAALLSLVTTSAGAQPEPASDAEPDPWTATLEYVRDPVWYATATLTLFPPGAGKRPPPQTMVMIVEPGERIYLETDHLGVIATRTRFTAWHRSDPSRVFESGHADADPLAVLAAKLPPLLNPLLAIAESGDPGRFPLLAGPASPRIETWTETDPPAGTRFVALTGTFEPPPADPAQPARAVAVFSRALLPLVAYRLETDAGVPVATLRIERSSGRHTEFPRPPDAAQRVNSLAQLRPPPAILRPGDPMPTAAIAAVTEDSYAQPVRPLDVFRSAAESNEARPAALLLYTFDIDVRNEQAESVASQAIVRARRLLANADDRPPRPDGLIARPLVLVDQSKPRNPPAWAIDHYATPFPPDRRHPEAERAVPGILWTPEISAFPAMPTLLVITPDATLADVIPITASDPRAIAVRIVRAVNPPPRLPQPIIMP